MRRSRVGGNPTFIPQDGVAVTHLAHDQKIAGSNPAPAPKIIKRGDGICLTK